MKHGKIGLKAYIPCKRVYLDYYEKLNINKSTVSDLLSKPLASYFDAMESLNWVVGENDYVSEITLPFTPNYFFKVQDFYLKTSYDVTYMYNNEVTNESLYSATYSTKVQKEIKCLIPAYTQGNYKQK